jgi:hypothetical protein
VRAWGQLSSLLQRIALTTLHKKSTRTSNQYCVAGGRRRLVTLQTRAAGSRAIILLVLRLAVLPPAGFVGRCHGRPKAAAPFLVSFAPNASTTVQRALHSIGVVRHKTFATMDPAVP